MKDFSEGIRKNENEQEYLDSLKEDSNGLVLNLGTNSKGKFTLHRATCKTLTTPLVESELAGKMLFHDRIELTEWIAANGHMDLGDLNECSRCL